MKDTNVTGNLHATGNADFDGSLTVGNAGQFVIDNTGVVTTGTWQAGTIGVQYGGSGATTFTQYGILFGNGTSAFGVTSVGTTGQCLLSGNGVGAPTWGTCTVSSLQSVYNASSPAEILLTDNKNLQFTAADTATDPSVIVKLNCTGCGVGANGNFIVQNNAGAALFSIAGSGAIQIGTASNGISLSGSGGTTTGAFTLSGTARNTKKIILTPEFAGAVLNASSDASCSGANNGSMTSGFDSTNRVSYYDWVSAAAATNCYNVIVQVPLPSDWDGWASAPTLQVRNSSGTNSTSVYAQIIRTDGTTDSGYASYQALSSGTTWSEPSLPSLNGSGYAADGYMTVKIRMSSPNTTTTVDVGNLTLTYYSKF
jgi:hypothetical protein